MAALLKRLTNEVDCDDEAGVDGEGTGVDVAGADVFAEEGVCGDSGRRTAEDGAATGLTGIGIGDGAASETCNVAGGVCSVGELG